MIAETLQFERDAAVLLDREISRSVTATASTPSERQVWIDYARGIGVILVVFGHSLRGIVKSGVFSNLTLAGWMDYTVYAFHMPLFFFLAGLNVQHSLRRGNQAFLVNKVWTIAYPYFLWSVLQGCVIIMLAHDVNTPMTFTDLAKIWYQPIGQFWFLYAIMICHVLVVLLPSRLTLIGIAFAGFAIYQAVPIPTQLSMTLYDLPFYVAGLYGPAMLARWQPDRIRGWTVAALVWFAFALMVWAGGTLSGRDPVSLLSLPACITGIAGIVLVCKVLDQRGHRWLAGVGVMSMTIYVLHVIAGSGARVIMLKLHVVADPWLYLVVGTSAGVMIPVGIHLVMKRLHLLAMFGLAPPVKTRTTRMAVST
ncbi:acyltransferase family protein [Lichenicola cladoniae]|uniref:acyltransferase family protein n=1 Tax=Lichenicola cladoniae TaxID=1484109 RepID=UPI0023B7A3EC|nr:acyltransferase [Lichenicola cladoniae]